ncbi:MAG: DNA polymerase [Thermoguttaceae bacterium]
MAQRQAVNIQGTAGDLVKMALIRLRDPLPDDVKMFLPVHGRVLPKVPVPLEKQTRQIAKEAIETPPTDFTVPLKVDIETGRTRADRK